MSKNSPAFDYNDVLNWLSRQVDRMIDHYAFFPLAGYVVLFGALWLGTGKVRGKVEKLPQFKTRSALSEIQFPQWLSEEALKELEGFSLEKNVLSPHLVPTTVAALKEIPWIREVKELRRKFPGQISLKLALRQPVAWIKRGKEKYYLDVHGTFIPSRYYRDLDLPEIVNWEVKGKKEESSRRLLHGVCVAQNLRKEKIDEKVEIAAIDVANVEGKKDPRESEILLKTKSSVTIEWGRAAISENPIKLPLAQKVQNLQKVLYFDPHLKKITSVRVQFGADFLPLVLKEKTKEE